MTQNKEDPDREVEQEFEFFIEMRTREYVADGLGREEARRRALREFGDRAAAEAACRELAAVRDGRQRRQSYWRSWLDDLRDGLRSMRRRPAAPLAVFVMLTAGMALTVAALALLSAVVRAEMPYPDSGSLIALQGRLTQDGRTQNWPAGYLDMVDLQEQVRPHVLLAVHSAARPLNLLTSTGAEVVHAEFVSASYFDVLRVTAAQGRTFTAEEDRRGSAAAIVVLSDHFWRQRLGASATAIGSTLVLNERGYTVTGIMPPGIRGTTDRAEVWLPVNAGASVYSPAYINARQLRWLSLVGRLEGRVSLAQGASALRSASLEIGRRDPQSNGGLVFEPLPLENRLLGAVPLSLYAAAAAAALVMFLVFVNVGGLSLSRSIAMQRDFAVRRALGASTARLFRQLAGQWLVVCGAAGLASVVVARGVLDGVVSSGAFTLPSFVDASITGRILLSVPILTAIGTILAASAPVLLARHSALALVATTNRSSATPAVRRLGQALIFAQVCVAAALLFTGVLMVRSVLRLQGGDLGWNPAGTAAMRIDLLGERYLQEAAKWRFADDLLSRLRSRLQVPAALSGPGGVPTGELFLTRLTIEDFRPSAGDATPFLSWHLVTPEYFDILGIQLRRGRFFTAADKAGAQPVAIVTDAFGRRFWPGADPVGRRIKLGARDNPAAPWVTVVGVTANVDFEPHARERDVVANEHFFVPFAQRAPSQPARAHLVVKTDGLAAVAAAARDALREVAPTLPIHAPIVLSDALERQTVRDRLIAALLTFLGATAFVVSVLGIYCTVAFEVSRRAPEYGIRLALGAARAHIVQLATAHTAAVVGGGLIAGLATGAALATLGRGLLFGVQPADTVATLLVAGLLAAGAGLGMWRPLRRAALTDPASVLRQN